MLLDRRAQRIQAIHGQMMQVGVFRAMVHVMVEIRISMVPVRTVLAGVSLQMVWGLKDNFGWDNIRGLVTV